MALGCACLENASSPEYLGQPVPQKWRCGIMIILAIEPACTQVNPSPLPQASKPPTLPSRPVSIIFYKHDLWPRWVFPATRIVFATPPEPMRRTPPAPPTGDCQLQNISTHSTNGRGSIMNTTLTRSVHLTNRAPIEPSRGIDPKTSYNQKSATMPKIQTTFNLSPV